MVRFAGQEFAGAAEHLDERGAGIGVGLEAGQKVLAVIHGGLSWAPLGGVMANWCFAARTWRVGARAALSWQSGPAGIGSSRRAPRSASTNSATVSGWARQYAGQLRIFMVSAGKSQGNDSVSASVLLKFSCDVADQKSARAYSARAPSSCRTTRPPRAVTAASQASSSGKRAKRALPYVWPP